jgi:hypothetical protein
MKGNDVALLFPRLSLFFFFGAAQSRQRRTLFFVFAFFFVSLCTMNVIVSGMQ